MNVSIKNCNNIDQAEISIEEGCLNIKYAINGTGKSTISKAIVNANDPQSLNQLIPFKYRTTSDHLPKVTGVPKDMNIAVFDETYVEQYEFQQNELIKNSYEIFIKTPEFIEIQKKVDDLIQNTKDLFQNNEDVKNLLDIINGFYEGFKATKTGFSAAGSLGKGLAKGNKIDNIPVGLEPYKVYIQNINNVSWLSWQLKGKVFLDIADSCPYCSTANISPKKEIIEKVSKEYEPKYVEHLEKMVKLLDSLQAFLTTSAKEKSIEIKKKVDGINKEQTRYLTNINDQIITLKQKLEQINGLGYFKFKDAHNIAEELKKYKIDLAFLQDLNSSKTKEQVDKINSSIDDILNQAKELNIAISNEKRLVSMRISTYQNEINEFLGYAGYSYKVSMDIMAIENKVHLYHKDYSTESLSGKKELSYGEKNAFAVILFMYDALNKKSDLIILDDPISSFDGNKKFAILYHLFSKEKDSFKTKTVLMLTHEFSTIIDIIKTLSGKFVAKGSYLYNKKGYLEEKEISSNDVLSFKQIMDTNMSNLQEDINKLVYLRRYLEFEKGKINYGYDVLSNLFHKRNTLTRHKTDEELKQNSESKETNMSQDEINKGIEEIKMLFPKFDYFDLLQLVIDNKRMISLYNKSTNGYEKLQIDIIICDDEGKEQATIEKYINETFHIENDYLFQLNPCKYEIIPDFVLEICNERISKYSENCLKEPTQHDTS